jgi:hypothetical protein
VTLSFFTAAASSRTRGNKPLDASEKSDTRSGRNPNMLLVARAHVDRDSVRGDLFPRHWTGLAKFSQTVKTFSRTVDRSWDWQLPEKYQEVSR